MSYFFTLSCQLSVYVVYTTRAWARHKLGMGRGWAGHGHDMGRAWAGHEQDMGPSGGAGDFRVGGCFKKIKNNKKIYSLEFLGGLHRLFI